MPKSHKETWLGLLVLGAGLVPVALVGLWGYMRATATPLHPVPQDVPSRAGAPPSPGWTEAVERAREIVRSGLAEQNLPGMSVAVGAGGRIVWAEGFGWADLETRVPVSPDTQFRIGTASIPLTSAAVGLLLERGRLTLDQPIQAYVPEFPVKEWPVTLRHLMGHTSGVRNDGGDEGPLFTVRCERPVDALPSFAPLPLLFEPGTRFRFSSYGWILVSAAVEAAAGEPFLSVMRQQVFRRLGMADTEADPETGGPGRATPYFPRFAAEPRYGLHLMRPIDYSCYAGASVFVSTPSDLVRFGLAIDGGTLLQPATVDLLQASQRLRSGEPTGYGLGWDLDTVSVAGGPTRAVFHDGASLGGRVASLLLLRERGIVVAVVSNISYADTRGVASKIAEAFAGHGASPARRS